MEPVINSSLKLDIRQGLPEDQLFLARQYPSDRWLSGPEVSELGRFWLGVHRFFRDKASTAERQVTSVLEGKVDAGAIRDAFGHTIGEMLSHLEMHHNIEDHNYFPQFIRIEPRLKTGFEVMDADHHLIHGAIHDLAGKGRAFLQAASCARQDSSATDRSTNELASTLTTFRRHMLRHLDDEEDLVIPLILDRHLG